MIRVFYGDDRVRANQEIKQSLGENYEVVDAVNLNLEDLANIFMGATFFDAHRRILIRDFFDNKTVAPHLADFLNTPHEIILLESKVDKRSVVYKDLKDKVEFKEFKLPPKTDFRTVFDIYRTAKTNGPRALELLEKVKADEDPIKFTGLLVSQALKDFTSRPNDPKTKQVLKELSKLDLDMKSTSIAPWTLVETFLLRLSTI